MPLSGLERWGAQQFRCPEAVVTALDAISASNLPPNGELLTKLLLRLKLQ